MVAPLLVGSRGQRVSTLGGSAPSDDRAGTMTVHRRRFAWILFVIGVVATALVLPRPFSSGVAAPSPTPLTWVNDRPREAQSQIGALGEQRGAEAIVVLEGDDVVLAGAGSTCATT